MNGCLNCKQSQSKADSCNYSFGEKYFGNINGLNKYYWIAPTVMTRMFGHHSLNQLSSSALETIWLSYKILKVIALKIINISCSCDIFSVKLKMV